MNYTYTVVLTAEGEEVQVVGPFTHYDLAYDWCCRHSQDMQLGEISHTIVAMESPTDFFNC